MYRFCERCERVTQDGNLWCQDPTCPAESGYPVLVYGDFLGDLKVTKLMRVWRTAALYEALRCEQPVLLKVAHEIDDCEERLKREAIVFQSLAERPPMFASIRARKRPLLPRILPPYPVPAQRPYGEISFRGETKFYSVFEHAEGKFLSDLMLENPQIWHYEAAWTAIAVAEALRPLAANNKCHLSLTPDMILVDTDKDGHMRPLLLDLGLIVEGSELESIYDWPQMCEPAYTAPELLAQRQAKNATPAADAYSLGMIYYQMLAGRPGFEPKLRRDDQVRTTVLQNRGMLPLGRPELDAAGVVKIVERAISPTERYRHVLELAAALVGVYGHPPKERRPRPRRFYAVVIPLLLVALAVGGVALYLVISLLQRFL